MIYYLFLKNYKIAKHKTNVPLFLSQTKVRCSFIVVTSILCLTNAFNAQHIYSTMKNLINGGTLQMGDIEEHP